MPETCFLTMTDVGEVLNVSTAQAYALIRRGDLPAIKIGGRGQWRVERTELEGFIKRSYGTTRTFITSHPFDGRSVETAPGDEPGR